MVPKARGRRFQVLVRLGAVPARPEEREREIVAQAEAARETSA